MRSVMRSTVVGLALALSACAHQVDGDPTFLGQPGLPGEVSLGIKSWQEQRFAGVVKQKFDFSCGSAALATLLRFHYGFDVAEEKAFRGMWAAGDRDQIRKLGFSLLDMKRWLAGRGITADGYRVDLAAIEKTAVPGIALITVDKYRHFVVVKSVRGPEVLLGDPSRGLTVMPKDQFLAAWNGIYFVLANDQAIGRRSFADVGQWTNYARAPVGGRTFADPVSQQALSLSAPFYGDIG